VTDRPGEHRDERDPAEEHEGPVVRDKRRIDPTTGEVREPAAGQPAPPSPGVPDSPADGLAADVVDELTKQVAERTADLQRLQAEYTNYRRRVERDREVIRDTAVANVLTNLLPVLDDIGRARDHGELEGGFKSVGEALEATVEKLGLERFGAAGDPFDPTVHEALTHTTSPEVTETTAVEVFQPGYRIGDRIVRPARVAVADPAQPEPPAPTE
jgi:molecular chaperone GrpE